uniref:DNA-directed DNA polymerase family A palm domain-containing protein n=1 Tax=Setaria viridis TaxID=4556 RepID=A0A4U6TYT7_SETVI|nr:hypothetical protein SEVIR_7G267401v2 [Setaria viridis]
MTPNQLKGLMNPKWRLIGLMVPSFMLLFQKFLKLKQAYHLTTRLQMAMLKMRMNAHPRRQYNLHQLEHPCLRSLKMHGRHLVPSMKKFWWLMMSSQLGVSSSCLLRSTEIFSMHVTQRLLILMLNKRHQLAMERSRALAYTLALLVLKLILEMARHAFGWMCWMVDRMSLWSLPHFLKIHQSGRLDGGYSLEGLTNDHRVMGVVPKELQKIGKRSMKTIFGRKKIKKDGSEGKITAIEPVEILQREDRELWICYSSLDSMSTLRLYESLKSKLERKPWTFDGVPRGSMYDFYEEYWRPFGAVLVKMETAGMLVDRAYLSKIEKVAVAQRKLAADKFRKWASKYCPDAKYMNVNSDTQIRQLFFGGIENRCKPGEFLPTSKAIKVPNDETAVAEGKKVPKYRTIELFSIVEDLKTDIFTASGWPSVSGDALRNLAGKVPSDLVYTTDDVNDDECGSDSEISDCDLEDTSSYGTAYEAFGGGKKGKEACHAIAALCEICSIDSLISNFILPLQGNHISCKEGRIHCSLNINTETGRLSARTPNLQNQPALEKDRYKIRQAFVAAPGNTLIVADYGQLELRILAHLADCKSMLDAFKAGGDFHSRTAMNMYQHIREAVEEERVILEWHPQPGQEKPPVPLLKDAFGAERRKAKMLNFSIAYGKTAHGLARDWKVSVKEAKDTLKLWYSDRKEVLAWQMKQKELAQEKCEVYTLLGRSRRFPNMAYATSGQRGHIERAAINAPVQGSAADVAMCAMLEIDRNTHLKELGWTLLLQVHDEVILEGPSESAELAKSIVVECMSKPFYGTNILNVDLAVDAKCAQNWYAAK